MLLTPEERLGRAIMEVAQKLSPNWMFELYFLPDDQLWTIGVSPISEGASSAMFFEPTDDALELAAKINQILGHAGERENKARNQAGKISYTKRITWDGVKFRPEDN